MSGKCFIIEHCENCQTHQWNTRHNPEQYKQYAINGKSYILELNLDIVANAIKENVPSADVKFNMVPKVHAMSDIYCQLVPNDDDNNPYYEVVPRIGSFEVSCNGVVSKF